VRTASDAALEAQITRHFAIAWRLTQTSPCRSLIWERRRQNPTSLQPPAPAL